MSIIKRLGLKKIVLGMCLICLFPLIAIVMRIIFIYGNYVGTQARIIMEHGICR